MKLSKHEVHRNVKYLNWLRKQSCVVSGDKAECTHHIRIGTNGGCALKPSDYFCIPLTNENHTTESNAIHLIGEQTFLAKYNIKYLELFSSFLKQYLTDCYDTSYSLEHDTLEELIYVLIQLIESKTARKDRSKPKVKISKEKIKVEKSASEKEFYEMAKVANRARQKEMRKKLKETQVKIKVKVPSPAVNTEAYEKAKELKKQRDKEYRLKNKAINSKYQKEQRKKAKEYSKKLYQK